jgi:uncharacterized protein DUF2568
MSEWACPCWRPVLCKHSAVGTFRALNLGARFLLELCAVTAVADWGWHSGGGAVAGALLGLVAGGAVVVVWGAVIAPRARRRLPDPQRLVVELMIFVLAGAGLAATGRDGLGIALAAVGCANAALVRVLGGEPLP